MNRKEPALVAPCARDLAAAEVVVVAAVGPAVAENAAAAVAAETCGSSSVE